jgi:hypothetical protein
MQLLKANTWYGKKDSDGNVIAVRYVKDTSVGEGFHELSDVKISYPQVELRSLGLSKGDTFLWHYIPHKVLDVTDSHLAWRDGDEMGVSSLDTRGNFELPPTPVKATPPEPEPGVAASLHSKYYGKIGTWVSRGHFDIEGVLAPGDEPNTVSVNGELFNLDGTKPDDTFCDRDLMRFKGFQD